MPEGAHERGHSALRGDIGIGPGFKEMLSKFGHLLIIPNHRGKERGRAIFFVGEIDVRPVVQNMTGGRDIPLVDGEHEGAIAILVWLVHRCAGFQCLVEHGDVTSLGAVVQ